MNDFNTLEKFVDHKTSEPFIRHVRFPRFKNLAAGTEIKFQYPITALIGANGTNKSSILRALQGCPNQYNIGDYWFDTPLDSIVDGETQSDRGPHRYIHGYLTPSGYLAEVIKTRVGKASRGADYFETSAPRLRDGMDNMPSTPSSLDAEFHNKTRWKPIEKNVVYLDFRQELPAYDILYHFNWRRKPNTIDWKKSQIRRGGPHIRNALRRKDSTYVLYKANRILEPAEQLTAAELKDVSRILQREYSSIGLVKHDFFGVEGYTATLKTDERSYSEAYAGSGEFAAIMLVRAITRADEASLIILDEPETSLHPGAQRGLMQFIARMCVTRHHQVVFATHSPAMVEELPDHARKLLDIDPTSGRVRLVAQGASVGEAFTRLGAKFSPRTILVEDELAREFVLRAARVRGKDFLSSIEVVCIPGGAQNLARRIIPVQAQVGATCALLLDGDQRPADSLAFADDVADSHLQAELDKIQIKESHLLRDGGSGDRPAQLTAARRKTLNWANKHVDYLPGVVSPDQLLLMMTQKVDFDDTIDAKKVWAAKTAEELKLLENEGPKASEILSSQRRALAEASDSDPRLIEILETLDRLLDQN
jgi:predicted ATPase